MIMFQLACLAALLLGSVMWVVGILTMLHNCAELSTLGLKGARLGWFSVGAITNWTGLALILLSAASAVYRMSGQSVSWIGAVGLA